ncbi:retrovirus-related pol polyprotein from transposon TNT 1-94 [Tanacetum coccineum]
MEAPKESLVNESLKKLKFHLAKFDNVVKIRTTPDARTEGEWGFEHTKAVFNNEIMPFLKSLKDIFNVFDKDLLNEIMEVQIVFDQMDVAVQHSLVDKQHVLLIMMNSMSLNGKSVNMERKRNESCDKCFNLDVELLETQNAHNDLLKGYSKLEKHCISLELSIQLNQEIFQKDESCDNQNALEIPKYFEKKDLKAQLQDKDTTICMFKLDLEPLAPRLLQNREAHIDYLTYTQDQANILQEIVKQAKAKQPLLGNVTFSRVYYVEGLGHKLFSLDDMLKTSLVVQIVLWYLDSGCSKHMTGNRSQLMNFVSKFLGTVRFGNDHIARIMGYGDYQLGNVTISRVYYVEGLGHNLFSVGQFCDADLEVAFQKNTCFIHNLEGFDLLSGSRDTNLYTISLDDMLKTSPICLLSKASKIKSWTKDEAPEAIIKCIKNIQVRLNATVRNVRTDNGTEFVNQTLREFYENVGISLQTSVACTPQ